MAGAIAALSDTEHLARTTQLVERMREWLTTRVDRLPGVRVVPGSAANFVLVRLDRPDLTSTALSDQLARRGLIVKDGAVSYLGLGERYVRIDIGPEPVMARLVAALREVLA